MDDAICPRCKTSKFQNPSMKMMVNVCGHALCGYCVDLFFLRGSGACPECQIPLRKKDFRVQMFEDPNVEKDVDIRKKILQYYNKQEDDFTTLAEYNDYLEEVETIIYNLTHDIDVMETKKKIEKYKKDNWELIMKNKAKVSKEQDELEEILRLEKQQDELRRSSMKLEEVAAKKRKIERKEALLDELTSSNADAANIVKHFALAKQKEEEEEALKIPEAKEPEKLSAFSTGVEFGQGLQATPSSPVKIDEEAPYVYQAPNIVIGGPTPPTMEQIVNDGYLKHVRKETVTERAGGFTSNVACMRALQAAMSGLYHVKRSSGGV